MRKLVTDGVCTGTTGFIGQNPDKNMVPPGVNYVVVSARKQSLLSAETATWAGELTVRAYAFSNLDIAMRDFQNLTQKAGNGIQNTINAVIQSLQLADLHNGGTYFLAMPMRYNRQDDIHRDIDQASKSYGWSYCDLVFDLVYGENPNYLDPVVNNSNEYSYEYNGAFT